MEALLKPPQVGISLMPEQDFLEAAHPLFQSGEIEVLEWSFDMGWALKPLPDYCLSLLEHYSQNGCLIGHGVHFSILSGQWTLRQEQWLCYLSEEVKKRRYRHISEHFGFMTAGNFHQSAPLPVPLTKEALLLGRSRMRQLADICGVPIGLENLAFAFCLEDVINQGIYLEELIKDVDGFIVLDLHNIYCQLCNFEIDPLKLLNSYPLHRVKELHVSGGSWANLPSDPSHKVRCDTHDEAVPEMVFELVELALQLCPQVEAIIFERMGNTFRNAYEIERYHEDFFRLKNVVQRRAQEAII